MIIDNSSANKLNEFLKFTREVSKDDFEVVTEETEGMSRDMQLLTV